MAFGAVCSIAGRGGQEAAVAVCSLNVSLWVISASDDLTVSRETERFHQRQGNHFIMVANSHYISSQESCDDQLITFIKHTETTKCHRELNIIIKNALANGKGGWVTNRTLKHSKSYAGNYWQLLLDFNIHATKCDRYLYCLCKARQKLQQTVISMKNRSTGHKQFFKTNDRPLPAL